MVRYRTWSLAAAGGMSGLVTAALNVLPPLPESILIGSSIGLITAGVLSYVVSILPADVTAGKVSSKAAERKRARIAVQRRIVRNFDELLTQVEEMDDPEVNLMVTKSIERAIPKLVNNYPEWHSEGRLRTYVLMKKLSDTLDSRNPGPYLDIAYQLLRTRGEEATEMSRMTLNGKVEGLYKNPEIDKAHFLAGTLLLMNRADADYAKAMAMDAIHLWSDSRFENLKEDFAAVSELNLEVRESVMDLLEREILKARRAKETKTIARAEALLRTVHDSSRTKSAS